MLRNWCFTMVPTSHLMRLTWENPITAVTFYCTVLESQAEEWAKRLYLRSHKGGRYVYRYLFRQTEDLKIKHFAALDQEWLEFIKENRTKGGIQRAYDVVVGPVADDNTLETVQLYLSGILKAEEAVERLRYNKVNNQVSFHTPLALEHLDTGIPKGGFVNYGRKIFFQ